VLFYAPPDLTQRISTSTTHTKFHPHKLFYFSHLEGGLILNRGYLLFRAYSGGAIFLLGYYIYLCHMIDLIREDRLIKSMLSRMPEIDGSDAVILAVEPERSGILAQRLAHAISVPTYLPVVLSVDIPDDRTEESYL